MNSLEIKSIGRRTTKRRPPYHKKTSIEERADWADEAVSLPGNLWQPTQGAVKNVPKKGNYRSHYNL